ITVEARHDQGGASAVAGEGAVAEVTAGSGGGLFAGIGAVATADADADTSATVSASGSARIMAGGAISARAKASNEASANVFSVAIGLVGVGSSFGTATAGGNTTAYLTGSDLRASSFAVTADSFDSPTATAFSGAGGLFAGSGAITNATANGTTTARVGSTLYARSFTRQTVTEGSSLPGNATDGTLFRVVVAPKIYKGDTRTLA